MKPEIEELLRSERGRLRKVAELRVLLRRLHELLPRDDKLIAMAKAELQALEVGPGRR